MALRFVCPLILFRCVVSVLWIHEIFLNPPIKIVAELVSVHCNLQNMEEMTHCFPNETYTKPWKAAVRPTFSAEMPQHKVGTMYWCILAACHGSLSWETHHCAAVEQVILHMNRVMACICMGIRNFPTMRPTVKPNMSFGGNFLWSNKYLYFSFSKIVPLSNSFHFASNLIFIELLQNCALFESLFPQ